MNVALKKLCKEINFSPSNSWDEVYLSNVQLEDNNIFNLHFNGQYNLPLDEFKKFIYALNKNFKYKSKPHFTFVNKTFDKSLLIDYISWILDEFINEKKLSFEIKNSDAKVDVNGDLNISIDSEYYKRQFERHKKKLMLILNRFGISNLEIFIKNNDVEIPVSQTFEFEIANYINNNIKKSKEKDWDNGFIRKNVKYEKINIEDLRESHLEHVMVEGKIFDISSFTTKNEITIFSIGITNNKEAIILKKFARDDSDKLWFNSLSINDYIIISGILSDDQFLKDFSIKIDLIKKIEKNDEKVIDDASKKRVELNTRTKMSVMDGISNSIEYYKKAKNWGHTSLAITDLDNVQAFPEFYNETKNDSSFKPIFGETVQILNKNQEVIIGNSTHTLLDATYVIFDLETTGLYAKYDGLIEFGAIKTKGNKIVDEKSFFINSNIKISEKIEQLTNITNKMISDAISEKEALQEIVKYFDDAILIAHNSKFDMSFINVKLEQYGLEPINNIVIDTLQLSRILEPNAKRHSLEYIAIKNNIIYDSSIAHRAIYDANVLAKIWIIMIKKMNNNNVFSINDMQNYNDYDIYNAQYSNKITILARTAKGLKNLYHLVSISHTKNYFNKPILFKENIQKYRKDLLIGSGGIDGLVFQLALSGTQAKLEKEIEFYDYIEVQPIENFVHLVNRQDISINSLQDAIKNIIDTAKKMNKIVVATSCSRYIEKDDNILHHIYIESKGLGGKAHSLFNYKDSNPKYPDLYLRTTKQMKKEFAFLKDSELVNEIVVDNTNIIANKIEKFSIIPIGLYTPIIKDSSKLLSDFVWKKAHEKYGQNLPEIIEARIKKELISILKYKYDVIYWIAHKLVAKSLSDGYIVGSRGSVGSSIVATLARITDVNPLEPHYYCKKCCYTEFPINSEITSGYDLPEKKCPSCNISLAKDGHTIPFETFLGFSGEKVPDIDLNFSGDYQSKIHDEVKKIFGESHCFRAGTISTVAERTAFGYIKAWCERKKKNFSLPFIKFIANRISGAKRTTGQHPGGIIVVPKENDVEDFTPVNYPANDTSSSWLTTHFDFHTLHNNLLKLDLLGHDDPTAIRMLQDLTNIKPDNIPVFDEKVIKLFSSTEPLNIKPEDISGETTGTMGIPEFGTKFVRSILKTVKVNKFSDLISVSGLSHGSDVWINNAKSDVKNLNLPLEKIISCRDDIMLDLTKLGIDINKAFTIMEQVRRGKSITALQEKELRNVNTPNWYIASLKKIKYMFPKAHATAYVKMAWKIAWFKIYYPLEYYATFFTTHSHVYNIFIMSSNKSTIHNKLQEYLKKSRARTGIEKITAKENDLIPILEITEELYARGYKISKINLESSDSTQWLIDKSKNLLIPPFISLDGLGISTAESIKVAREKSNFLSIEDLLKRSTITKTNIEDLKKMGVLEGLPNKNQLSLF